MNGIQELTGWSPWAAAFAVTTLLSFVGPWVGMICAAYVQEKDPSAADFDFESWDNGRAS